MYGNNICAIVFFSLRRIEQYIRWHRKVNLFKIYHLNWLILVCLTKKRIFKITYIVDISAAGLLQNQVKTVQVHWLYEKYTVIVFFAACRFSQMLIHLVTVSTYICLHRRCDWSSMKTYVQHMLWRHVYWLSRDVLKFEKTDRRRKRRLRCIFHITIVPELFSLNFEEGLRPKYQQYM